MKVSFSSFCLFSLIMVTCTILNVTTSSFSAGGESIHVLSVRDGKNKINVIPSLSYFLQLDQEKSTHAAFLTRRKSSANNKKEQQQQKKKKSSKKSKNKTINSGSSNKKSSNNNGKKKTGGSNSCKDRACPLVLKPCPKDCPQSCGYLNSPDPCCPLLGKPTCPDY